ncbi:hypothetical protein PR048_033345 [Dryococelus australis]|uniref:Uncharacterized protein n=1 Tax=Dryococelus australis TaxID=614101 RepID=A0ABQ9G005_9NEOP|nr:hypothetical protein PR048_033345 [Dryococelus australis]
MLSDDHFWQHLPQFPTASACGTAIPDGFGVPCWTWSCNARLHHRGSKLDPRSDLRSIHKSVAPFEFRAGLEIEMEVHFEPPKLAVRNLDPRSEAIVDKCSLKRRQQIELRSICLTPPGERWTNRRLPPVTADNPYTVDIGTSVHMTVESSQQVIELAHNCLRRDPTTCEAAYISWGRGGRAVSILASHQGEPCSIPGPGHSLIFTRRCRRSTEFSRGSPVSPASSFRRSTILTSLHPQPLPFLSNHTRAGPNGPPYLMAMLHGTRFRKSYCHYTGLYGTRHGVFLLALPDFITGLVIGPVLFFVAGSIPALVPGQSHRNKSKVKTLLEAKPLSQPLRRTGRHAAWFCSHRKRVRDMIRKGFQPAGRSSSEPCRRFEYRQNQDIYMLPRNSYLRFRGNLTKAGVDVPALIKIIRNCVLHMIDQIFYEFKGIKLDQTRYVVNSKQDLAILLPNTQANAFVDTAENPKVQHSIEWLLPHVEVKMQVRIRLPKFAEKERNIDVAFRLWSLETYSGLTQSQNVNLKFLRSQNKNYNSAPGCLSTTQTPEPIWRSINRVRAPLACRSSTYTTSTNDN